MDSDRLYRIQVSTVRVVNNQMPHIDQALQYENDTDVDCIH